MASYAADFTGIDGGLAGRLRTSEDGAFQELFHRFGNKIFRTALRILKEEESAKDALQETMVNIHRSAETFRGEARLSTWINRITVNVCFEMIRKNKKHKNRVDDDISQQLALPDEHATDPFAEVRRLEIRRRVRSALSRLSEKHEVVVRMHDLEGYTIREIAGQVGVAEGTIKSRLFYGREELRKQLES